MLIQCTCRRPLNHATILKGRLTMCGMHRFCSKLAISGGFSHAANSLFMSALWSAVPFMSHILTTEYKYGITTINIRRRIFIREAV